MPFYGQDQCTVDANGRVKLSPRLLMDFGRDGDAVVLHCLPEGAIGVYPTSVWDEIRASETEPASGAASSVIVRRRNRRYGALSQMDTISKQGRITVPSPFRSLTGLNPGSEAVLVGVEVGVEIWNAERWNEEFQVLLQHEQERANREMRADLNRIDDTDATPKEEPS